VTGPARAEALPPRYEPAAVESRWYARWEKDRRFAARPDSGKEPYVIAMPPPNVTGILHMGHALNNTIQDILVRFERMRGRDAVWLPGTDHAGIATQNVVEQALKQEGKGRDDLGREAFVARCWEWQKEYGGAILEQLKRLGVSCDWSRTAFTMDKPRSKAVQKMFLDLHAKGLIYRGEYIIHWCPRCQTALSDEESEHVETKGKLWHFRYPLADGSGHVVVATTRPETMLGDTAVAVHPEDLRYKALVGNKIRLPLVGREIPVIADEMVDPKFGTGAVKVTPAHDPNDFQTGKRHALATINVMTDDGRMNAEVPEPYRGLERFQARKRVVADLEAQGLVEKIDEHVHAVGHCYRCDTVVEPRLSPQWFVRMEPLAEPAISAVRKGEVTISPERWEKVYFQWMENIRDWCISRQIWWGHRIPAWYCRGCRPVGKRPGLDAEPLVSATPPASCPRCGGKDLVQDPDVLDTWFSSWLWPMSTLGWPEEAPDLARYYPGHSMVTASEILFFWVARMMMAGHFVLGRMPFSEVLIHGTVRDEKGQKMSKSLGNGIDPLVIIDTYGADALRFSLMVITAKGQDVHLAESRFEMGRNFANKLWNAMRLVLMQGERPGAFDPAALAREDLWILSRLQRTVVEVTRATEARELNAAALATYHFLWDDFCDWYLEIAKERFRAEGAARRQAVSVAAHVLEAGMRLLHPVMPFVTEEIWQALRDGSGEPSVMTAPWPVPEADRVDTVVEADFEVIRAVVRLVRDLRSKANVLGKVRLAMTVSSDTSDTASSVDRHRGLISRLANADLLDAGIDLPQPPGTAAGVGEGLKAYVAFEWAASAVQARDDAALQKERARLEAQRAKVLSGLAGADRKLADPSFSEKAPPAVVARERARREEMASQLKALDEALKALKRSGNL
jgi:valyl-tRNA synthetase